MRERGKVKNQATQTIPDSRSLGFFFNNSAARSGMIISLCIVSILYGNFVFANELGDNPELQIDEVENTYIVDSPKPSQWMSQFQTRGPRAMDGLPKASLFTQSIQTEFQLLPYESTCELLAIKIILQIRSTMPKYVPTQEVKEEVMAEWRYIYAQLEAQNIGARAHGIEAIKKLHARMRNLPREQNCKVLRNKLLKLSRQVSNSLRISEQKRTPNANSNAQ